VTVAAGPLHELVDRAIKSYCQFLSFEHSHLDCWQQQEWLRREAEEMSEVVLPREQRWAILKHLFRAGVPAHTHAHAPPTGAFSVNQSTLDCAVVLIAHKFCTASTWPLLQMHGSISNSCV
jgi:hypothetical protein